MYKSVVKVFASFLLISSHSVFAGFGPKSVSYNELASLVGTWKGEVFGKPFEIAIWPDKSRDHLSGAMLWGACRSVIEVNYSTPYGLSNSGITKANPRLDSNQYLYSMISRLHFVNFSNNQCPSTSYPGYSHFYLSSDKNHQNLSIYTLGASWPKLKKQPGTMTRSAPSAALTKAINKMARKNQYKLTQSEYLATTDPTKDYLELSKLYKDKAQASRLIDIRDAKKAFTGRDFQRAFQIYKSHAESPHSSHQAEAQYWLCRFYGRGLGVKKDAKQAVHWCQQSASSGYFEAKTALLHLYEFGEGVKDPHKAFAMKQELAKSGDAKAQLVLADAYFWGKGVKRDENKAIAIYEKYAKAGNTHAQYKLGSLYSNQLGKYRDWKKGFYWTEKA